MSFNSSQSLTIDCTSLNDSNVIDVYTPTLSISNLTGIVQNLPTPIPSQSLALKVSWEDSYIVIYFQKLNQNGTFSLTPLNIQKLNIDFLLGKVSYQLLGQTTIIEDNTLIALGNPSPINLNSENKFTLNFEFGLVDYNFQSFTKILNSIYY